MKEKLSAILNRPVSSIDKLFGEASYRTYYRARTTTGESYIVMAMPAGKMSVSEEITNLKTAPKELPFINVQKYLKTIGLPVPEIILFNQENRWIILEDLSDTKLADCVADASTPELIAWYKKAIDLLVEMQKKARPTPDCVAFQRTFDATLLNWEFDHFWEYYVSKGDCFANARNDKTDFIEETRKITNEILQLPTVFVHRDFQSKNLMFHNDKLYLIDFQDALLGPKPYDLVALLRDSYVDLTPHLDELIGYYCEKAGENVKNFRRAFDLQTVQRKMKDAGRFVFIDQVKKNPNFLQYIPCSIEYVKKALEKLPEYSGLLPATLRSRSQ
ncbi:MAG: phosphotransferase [Deltaproteobacteria bacterium]|nr:phosphotransferase [Deltaproteobacteria bacterium]